MWTRKFWAATGERAVRTFLQTFLATAVASGVFDVLHADWVNLFSVSAGAALLSVVTSLAGSGVGDPESPAFNPPSPEEVEPQ